MAGPLSAVVDVATSTGAQESFAAEVSAITAAFGDPTRREIYLALQREPGQSAKEVAQSFHLHPNVARHHLSRLVAGGYLSCETVRPHSGSGRPSKRYSPVGVDPVTSSVAKRDDLLVLLLQKALERLGPHEAEELAAQVGESYGRSLADKMGAAEGQRSIRSAMATVAQAMTAHGFAARTETFGDETTLVADRCPFGDAAAHHPVLCAVDHGMVKGLLDGLCGNGATPVTFSTKARGDADCRSTV